MSFFWKLTVWLTVIFVLGVIFYRHGSMFPWGQQALQYMPNMYRTQVYIPMRGSNFFENGSGARVPPNGSVARNDYTYAFSPETPAERVPRVKNPLRATREVVLRGQHIYMTYCVVCHGEKGNGQGYIVPKFPMPPSLHSSKVQNLADSQIYHIITSGQNLMGSYAPQIRESDRWAAIHFIRALQLAENPTKADVTAYEKSEK